MTAAHFIYIPGILLLGIVIGFILGSRAATTAKLDREALQRSGTNRRQQAEQARQRSEREPS